MLLQIFIFLVGLFFIVKGADWLVDGASSVAKRLGSSDFVIGLTIVGMGTSAPEMVVSFIGAIQGNADIAIGNVMGSNIFNVLLILGVTAVICPMTITSLNRRKDIPINIFITVLLLGLGMTHKLFGFGTDTLGRLEGAILVVLFATYIYLSFRFDVPDENSDEDEKPVSIGKSVFMIVAGLAGLILGGQFFVNSATSIAKLALGNILGSNVFNILLILGGSALIHPLSFAAISYVDAAALLVSALAIAISIYTFKRDKLDRADGICLLILEIAYMTWLIIDK